LRFALLSDIHANVESLEAVLARIPASDALLCLGDIVGYGPNPNECLALVRERANATVLGNHDVAAVDGYGIEYFNPAARRAIDWTRSVIAPEHAAWLDGLSYEIRTDEYLMVHGAPVEYFTYILDKASAAQAFAETDAPLIFVGHTHIADYYVLAPDGSIAHGFRQRGGRLDLEPGMRYIVNAGSVGQPRDRNPAASYATFDSQERSVVWERVAYPLERTQEKIEAANLPEYLARRLESGR
jgi:diadenosine tetraphosphatase ApaH/serine/threonine PP2A family protein phosphatase